MFLFFGFFKEKHIQRESGYLVFWFLREVYGFCAFAFTFLSRLSDTCCLIFS
ncbi:hypothetical protein OIU74_017521, partial [Salix koriyanagi]